MSSPEQPIPPPKSQWGGEWLVLLIDVCAKWDSSMVPRFMKRCALRTVRPALTERQAAEQTTDAILRVLRSSRLALERSWGEEISVLQASRNGRISSFVFLFTPWFARLGGVFAVGKKVMQSNIERFNLYTAHIFGMLYKEFPVAREIVPAEVVKELSGIIEHKPEETDKQRNGFVAHTLRWLSDTHYLMADGQGAKRYVLAPRAFEALSATLSALEGKRSVVDEKSVGQQLVDVSKDLGKEFGNKAKSEIAAQLVGTVIGHAMRVLTTPG